MEQGVHTLRMSKYAQTRRIGRPSLSHTVHHAALSICSRSLPLEEAVDSIDKLRVDQANLVLFSMLRYVILCRYIVCQTVQQKRYHGTDLCDMVLSMGEIDENCMDS